MNHFARRQFDLARLHNLHLRKTDRPTTQLIAFVELDLNLSFLRSADRNIKEWDKSRIEPLHISNV